MLQPFLGDLFPPSRRQCASEAEFKKRVAQHGANILMGYFNYVECGCPHVPVHVTGTVNALQEVAGENVRDELLSFIRHDRGVAAATLGGGRARLAEK